MNFPDSPVLDQLYSFSGITWKWNGIVWKIDTSSSLSLSVPITWTTSGLGPPTFTTRSAGTKLVLYPSVSSTAVDFALGMETGAMWYSVQDASATHKWYAGTTNIATLGNTGLTVPGTITGVTTVQAKPATSSHGWINVQPGNATISGYLEFMSATGGIRQGYIGATNTNSAIDTGLISYTAGTHNFGGVISATTTGSTGTVTVTDTGGNGANLRLNGNGGTTPNKYIRAANGLLEVLNSAYNTTLLSLTDAGALTITGNVAAFNLSLGGKLTTSGAFTTTFTVTGNTAITLPTTGTIYSGSAGPVLGGIIYGSSTTQYGSTAAGLANQVLISNGAAAPSWANLDLSNLPDAWTKKIVKMATTGVLTVTARTATTLTIGGTTFSLDGITAANNDRVLVKNATTGVAGTGTNDNGIYTVSGIGTSVVLTRSTDADTSIEMAGATVNVDLGTVNGGLIYTNDYKSTGTLGTTLMNWYQLISSNDAVSTNTANKIVIRDASGNFSAGTITAALTGNATTATTLQTARNINGVSFNGSADITITASNPNALTMNSGGAGAASGTTYTGAAAQTISYNTIGAPSTTGTNASGTWGISITGNSVTCGGFTPTATSGTFSRIVVANTSGYIENSFFSGTDEGINGSSGTVSSILAKHGDNFYRSTTAASVGAFLASTPFTWTGTHNFLSGNGVGLSSQAGTLACYGNTAATNAAVMSFHRPGAYAINMGLDTDNVFRIGGWSDGASVYRFSLDASGNGAFRGNLSVPGEISTVSTPRINNASPTFLFQDTDGMVAFLHNNSNLFYVLRNATANSTTWDSGPNGRHPMTMNLSNGDVAFSGDVIAYSDINLKKNIKAIEDPLNKVLTLHGITYDHIEGKRGTGLIAQELQEVLPEAVHIINGYAPPGEVSENYLGISYGNVNGLLVEAIKELNEKIKALQAEIKSLKKR